MKLILGLGNPEPKYLYTRHNIGFLFIDLLYNCFGQDVFYTVKNWENSSKFNAQVAYIYGANKIIAILAKPNTFMNNSGLAVKAITDFYKKEIDFSTDFLVAFDDLDIKLGEYKFIRDKYPKAHNGILSIHNHMHSLQYYKLRIGIENRQNTNVIMETKLEQTQLTDPNNQSIKTQFKIPGQDYVLQNFTDSEKLILAQQVFPKALATVRDIFKI